MKYYLKAEILNKCNVANLNNIAVLLVEMNKLEEAELYAKKSIEM